MNLTLEQIQFALLITAIVSMFARQLRLPYTVGLVLAGIGVAVSPLPLEGALLTKDLIYKVFLPPLIFEAAFMLNWHKMQKNLPVTLLLATIGVVIAAGIIAAGAYYILGWPWQAAALFGALISATDPVSVIATFKSAKVEGRLAMLVESESLMNDGMAVVLFTVIMAMIAGNNDPDIVKIAESFFTIVGGGIACGALVGGAVLLLLGRTNDHLVEITFTTVAAYGSFLLAEHFHVSGVLATLVTGLMLGNIGRLRALSDKGRTSVVAFWEYIGFVVNSLIFLFIGMPLAHHDFAAIWLPLAIMIGLILFSRVVSVYGCCAVFAPFEKLKVSLAHQHILVWGGLRGALSLALVLGLPTDIPMHGTIVATAFGVVAFSIIVQGITMGPLLKKLGLLEKSQPPQ